MILCNYKDFVADGIKGRAKNGRPMDPSNLLLELVGELGEVLNAYKHAYKWPDRTDTEQLKEIEHLKEELGDLIWYINAVVIILGFDIDDIKDMNVQKLVKRYQEEDAKRNGQNKSEKFD